MRKRRNYQPNLGKDNNRLQLGVRVPKILMDVIKDIARDENRTLSSVADEIVCSAFGVDYKTGKLRSITSYNKKGIGNVIPMFSQVSDKIRER